MKVYIAGKITGNKNYVEQFEKAEKVLDYNISISAYGDSELNITFDISDALAEIETEDTEKEEKKITKFDAIKGMQNLKSIARSGYPLSLDLKQ